MGGISKLGGINAEQLLTKVAGIDNAVWRVAAAAGVKIGSEVTEEITALLTATTTWILEGGDISSYSDKDIKALVEQSKEQIREDGEKALQSGKMPDDAHLEIMELNSAQYAANADAANPTAAQTTVEPVQPLTKRDIIDTTNLWMKQINDASGLQSDEFQMVSAEDASDAQSTDSIVDLKPKALMEELMNSGEKCYIDEVVAITRNSDNKLLWLEQGNHNAGLTHIIEGHKGDFFSKDVENIPQLLIEVLKTNPTKKGRNSKEPYAEYVMNGNAYRVAYGDNGFIVSFYPID